MNISKIFNLLSNNNYQEFPVLFFTYEFEFPSLFFSDLFKKLSKIDTIFLKNIHSSLLSKELFEAEINTTFLGETRTLWLGSISDLSTAEQSKILYICQSYKGPHRIIVCCATKELPKSFSHSNIFNIDQELTHSDKESIISFFYPSLTYASIQKISGGATNLNKIDNFIMLAHYAMVLGRNSDAFVRDWLPKIIISESSLFTLSQYFFSKKNIQFWNVWNDIKYQYSSTFWTVYWTEQIWRAYYVIVMQQKNNIIDARKMAYRLPFSFIQKDWKNVTLSKLSQAHSMLYQIDWRIKNGGSEDHFDLFFYNFFM